MQAAERQHMGGSADGIDLTQFLGHGRLVAQRHSGKHGILFRLSPQLPVTLQQRMPVTKETEPRLLPKGQSLPRIRQQLPTAGSDKRPPVTVYP